MDLEGWIGLRSALIQRRAFSRAKPRGRTEWEVYEEEHDSICWDFGCVAKLGWEKPMKGFDLQVHT